MHLQPTVIALGFFDGVHRGHGALLRRTVEQATALGAIPAVFTFDRPPKEVVTGQPVPLINSPTDRCQLIRRLYGIDRIIMAPFDQAMMTMGWQDFITSLAEHYGAIHLVAGHDYRFGHRNEGTPERLQQGCAELGLGCDIIPKVAYDGVTVSSTHIRSLVACGHMERAAAFLGHPHCLTQTVCHGMGLGHTIDMPTINLPLPPSVLPPLYGVYAAQVHLPDGKICPGVTNVGVRPTVSNSGQVSVETHLLDFEGNLYGHTVRLDFCRRLRNERRFGSLAELRSQILLDIDDAQSYFTQN